MGSGNWIVDNLNSALEMWNGRLAEIWQLITTSPENFKGGGIWNVIVGINGGLKAVGYALLVLFFVMGVVKTCGSFTEMKKPEVAFKCFIRFVLAQAAVSWGMELMTGAFRVAQGMVTTIMDSSGLTAMSATTLPDELVSVIEDVGFIDSIPLWAVTLLGSLFIWVLSLVMILTVYSRFFKLYIATAIAPIPLASFAGQPSSSIGVAFLKSYAAICLEGCVIVLACVIFSAFASSPPAIADDTLAAATIVWNYLPQIPPRQRAEDTDVYFNELTAELVGLIKAATGHALVLFTSYAAMSAVKERLWEESLPFPLLTLGRNAPHIIEQFRHTPGAVLLATGAAWEGFDFPGDCVSLLIIPRLPFAYPDARKERELEKYSSLHAFIREVAVPEMQIKLRQGFGRAIRTESDTCVIAILDERACRGRRYAQAVSEALPEMRRTGSLREVTRFLREKKPESYFEVGR